MVFFVPFWEGGNVYSLQLEKNLKATASGEYPTAHTIAVDASNPFVPIGTKVVMNGVEYTVKGSIASLTNQTFTNFVSGQLTEAVIIGVLCFFGTLVLGIPYAGVGSAFVVVTAPVQDFFKIQYWHCFFI